MIPTALVIIAGAIGYGIMSEDAPVWDEDHQMPAEDVSAAAERA